MASFLIDAGADVAWPDQDGYSALHMAAGYVHSSVVQALLAAGADPEQEDKAGRSPLSLVQGLLERTPANNPLQVGDETERGGRWEPHWEGLGRVEMLTPQMQANEREEACRSVHRSDCGHLGAPTMNSLPLCRCGPLFCRQSGLSACMLRICNRACPDVVSTQST